MESITGTDVQVAQPGFFSKIRSHVYPLFWFIAAADESILRECPAQEQDKQASIGMAIVCTTIAAMISSYYAVHSLFANVMVAVLIGVFWGIIIFNLDRFMVGSIYKRKKQKWQGWSVAVPRILLAAFIAVIISKPLEVKIFHNQIEEARSGFIDSLQSQKFRFESATLDKQEGAKKSAQSALNDAKKESNDLTRDQAYMQFKADYNDCQDQKAKLNNRISDKRTQRQLAIQDSNSIAAARLQNDIDNLSKQVRALQCEQKKKLMDDRAREYVTSQLARVKDAETRVNKLNSHVDSAATELDKKRSRAQAALDVASEDILGRLRILDFLKQQDDGMFWADWLITSLFFLLEVAPILVKMLSPRGKYDTLLAIMEKEALDNEEAAEEESNQKKIYRKKIALNNTAHVEEIDDMVKQQIQEKILSAQADLATRIVDAWKQQEEAELDADTVGYLKKIISKTA